MGRRKALVNKIQQDKQEIENLKFEAERMEREGNYERVAEIRYSKLKALEDDIKKIQEQLKSTQVAQRWSERRLLLMISLRL